MSTILQTSINSLLHHSPDNKDIQPYSLFQSGTNQPYEIDFPPLSHLNLKLPNFSTGSMPFDPSFHNSTHQLLNSNIKVSNDRHNNDAKLIYPRNEWQFSFYDRFYQIQSFLVHYSKEDPVVQQLQQFIGLHHPNIIERVIIRLYGTHAVGDNFNLWDRNSREMLFQHVCVEFKEILSNWCQTSSTSASYWIAKSICDRYLTPEDAFSLHPATLLSQLYPKPMEEINPHSSYSLFSDRTNSNNSKFAEKSTNNPEIPYTDNQTKGVFQFFKNDNSYGSPFKEEERVYSLFSETSSTSIQPPQLYAQSSEINTQRSVDELIDSNQTINNNSISLYQTFSNPSIIHHNIYNNSIHPSTQQSSCIPSESHNQFIENQYEHDKFLSCVPMLDTNSCYINIPQESHVQFYSTSTAKYPSNIPTTLYYPSQENVYTNLQTNPAHFSQNTAHESYHNHQTSSTDQRLGMNSIIDSTNNNLPLMPQDSLITYQGSNIISPMRHPEVQYPSFWLYNIGNTDFYLSSNYVAKRILGGGTYGVVLSAHDSKLNMDVAIKKQSLGKFGWCRDYFKRLMREIRILHHVDHPNLMCLIDLIPPLDYQHFDSVYIVTQKMDRSLKEVIHGISDLNSEHIGYFMYQMTSALRYLHGCSIIHRDFKPENILINENCELRVIDFGLSKVLPMEGIPRNSTNIVSLFYRAPELLLGSDQFSEAVDIWSLGAIFAEMFYPARRALFHSNSCTDALRSIFSLIGSPSLQDLESISEHISKEGYQLLNSLEVYPRQNFRDVFPLANDDAIDLIERMLVFDPKNRISASEVLNHPYLRNLGYNIDESEFDDVRMDTSWEQDFDQQTRDPKRLLYDFICEFNLQQNNYLVGQGMYRLLGEKHCLADDNFT